MKSIPLFFHFAALIVALVTSIQAIAVDFHFVDNETGIRVSNVSCMIRDLKSDQLTSSLNFRATEGCYEALIASPGYKRMNHRFALTSEDLETNFVFHLVPESAKAGFGHEELNALVGEGFNVFVVTVVDDKTFEPLADVLVKNADSGVLLGKTSADGYLRIKIPVDSPEETVNLIFEKSGYKNVISTEVNLDYSYQLKRLRLQKGSGSEYSFELNYEENHDKADLREHTAPWQKYSSFSMGNYSVCEISTVSVGFANSSLASCPTNGCNMNTCGHVEVFDIDEYVKRVLPAEWLLSWQNIPNGVQAFRAGAVAIRTFAAWYVIHPQTASYDICSSTCCQVIGTSTFSSTTGAVNTTAGFYLWDAENSEEARSEYTSEGNNLPTTDGNACACISNTCGCGNGFIGRSNTGFPCFSDPVGFGNEGFGHGRGMSQYGTARWASGLALGNACNGSSTSGPPHGFGTKDWQEILNHYYGAYYEIIECGNASCGITINQEFADLDCFDPLINVVVFNSGNTVIPSANVFYLITSASTGAIIGSDFGVSSLGTYVNMQPNQSLGFQWEVPNSVLDQMCGQYNVLYNIIPSSGCAYFGSFAIPGSVSCGCPEPAPDIAITDITFSPASPVVGQSVEICVEYVNLGAGDASDVDVENITVNGSTIASSIDGPDLDAGDSATRCTSYVFNSSGTFQICATVEDFADEPNLANNVSCTSIQVTPLPCSQPSGLLASGITTSSVNLSWQAVPNAISYTVERRVCNSSQWLSLGTPATTSITWSTVECGTCYEWRVRTNCASGASGFTSSSFNTPSCGCVGIQGCTNPTACNFNPLAQCDNGTCEFVSCLGCTIPNACNYDQTATINDGSCEFNSCAGCTDPLACNYDPTATISNGNCTYPDGCTDQTACNYDPNADCDNGTCEFISCSGCTNSIACNFDEDATIDDGSCILPDGCTDQTACNYDADATCDDGSCTYPPALTINGLATVPQGLVTSYVSSPNIPGGQYTWNLNPSSYGTIDNPNATAIVVSYSEVLIGPGQLCVTVDPSGSNNCSSSTCLDLNLVVGLEELSQQAINVYPNPASDYLVIDVPIELGLVQTDLYNSIGQLIITQSTVGLHRIDISALSKGMYHCVVRTKQSHNTFKVQKH